MLAFFAAATCREETHVIPDWLGSILVMALVGGMVIAALLAPALPPRKDGGHSHHH